MNKTSVSSSIFFKCQASLYRGQFCLNSGIHLTEVLAQTLWLWDRLRHPGLICSKANEFKKWQWLRLPHEIPSCGWDGHEIVFGWSGFLLTIDELALFLCRKSRCPGSDPVGCNAEGTWNLLSLGLIGLEPTPVSLSWDCLRYHGGSRTYTALDSEGLDRSDVKEAFYWKVGTLSKTS